MTRSELDDRIAMFTACAALGGTTRTGQRDDVLTTQEWSHLARWLIGADRRPAELLFPSIVELIVESDLDRRIVKKVCSIPERASATYEEMTRMQEGGIWTICRADDAFPARWKQKLGWSAPPVIFGAGQTSLMGQRSVSIVGSRSISGPLAETARALGKRVSESGMTVVSGAAKGTDLCGMQGALAANGQSVGVLPGNLRRHASQYDLQPHIASDHLCLVSHVHPSTGFLVRNAMARNRLIYAQSELTIVISSSEGSGGTWAGADENLRRRIAPIAVWTGKNAPPANQALAELGALRLNHVPASGSELQEFIDAATAHFQAMDVKRGDRRSSAEQSPLSASDRARLS